MMARKLSIIAPRVAACSLALLLTSAASFVRADGDVQVTKPTGAVENPYASPQPKPRAVADEPQSVARGPVTYQNPFANMSKAPPVDNSFRPGPISRWQHPVIPASEPSAIKTAVLTVPAIPQTNTSPTLQTGWRERPGDAVPQYPVTAATFADPAGLAHLGDPDPIIRSIPNTVSQPDSIGTPQTVESAPAVDFGPSLGPANASLAAPSTVNADVVIATLAPPTDSKVDATVAAKTADPSETSAQADPLPSIVSDSGNPPVNYLNQAQDAATAAETPEQLGAVISLCDQGLQATPSAGVQASLRRLSAWAHNRRGEMLADSQRTDDAVEDFRAAITLDPKCSLAIHNRGVTLAQRNQYGAALRDFNRVIELNPGLAIAYRNRAELLAALGRMEEAIADYNQAVSSLPEDPSLLCARAHAYQRIGNFARATADVNRAIQLSPHDAGLITERGNLAAEQGRFEQAQNDFQSAIAADANCADAYRSLAWLQATCSDPKYRNAEQSLANANKAANLFSADDYLALDTLAAATARSGDFQNATSLEEKAIAAAPRELSTPLEERRTMYQHNKAFMTAPAKSQVQTVSHETPVRNAKSGTSSAASPR